MTNLRISLLAAEEARRQAMLASDTQKLNMMFSSSMTYTHSSGMTDSKQAYLQSLSSKTITYETIVLDNLQIRLLDQVGLIAGTMKASLVRGGICKQIAAQYMAVWENIHGHWLLHAIQATSLPVAD